MQTARPARRAGCTSSKRMRDVATQIAFLREQVKDTKRVRLTHIRTQGQVADLFTKPLTAAVFHPLYAHSSCVVAPSDHSPTPTP